MEDLKTLTMLQSAMGSGTTLVTYLIPPKSQL